MISVALIEDNRLVREGITALLSQLPDLKVVAGTSAADTSVLREAKPQVVLLDLGLTRGRFRLFAIRFGLMLGISSYECLPYAHYCC